MKITVENLNKKVNLMEMEQYRSRDNRVNGSYWKHCWAVFQETEKLLKALMGVWRYPAPKARFQYTELCHFPEVDRFATVRQYPPPQYKNEWHYIGRDIRFKIATREETLWGKPVICLSGFTLQHTFANMENSWSNPVVAGEYADEAYRPVKPKNK